MQFLNNIRYYFIYKCINDFYGKTKGGSRGIGLMIAQTFVAAGANVLLTSRSEQACKDAVQSISDSNSNSNDTAIQYVASNVSNREGCEELAEYTSKVFNNKLDVLINNAGTSWGEPLERRSGKKVNWGFDKVFDLVRILLFAVRYDYTNSYIITDLFSLFYSLYCR